MGVNADGNMMLTTRIRYVAPEVLEEDLLLRKSACCPAFRLLEFSGIMIFEK
jgi:hypothetical protein